MSAICDMLLGYILFKPHLVPRGLSLIGIVGGPILLVGYFAVMLGLTTQHSSLVGLSAVFVALFECSLGLWLGFKVFNSRAVAVLESKN